MSTGSRATLQVKRAVVVGLEVVCGVLDRIPRYEQGRWYRHGCWGCSSVVRFIGQLFHSEA